MKLFSLLKRLLNFIFRLGIWTATAAVLLSCLLLARIFVAPLSLDFARDMVVEQVASFLPGWDVSYSSAEIGWDWQSVKPWITIDNIQLIDRRDRLQAGVPRVRIDVSFASLFGSAGISSIEVYSPIVNVSDLAGFSDGTDDSLFDTFFNWDGPPKPAVFKPITAAFSRFTGRLLANAPRLEYITFQNINVAIARTEGLPKLELTMPSLRLLHEDGKLQLTAQVDALVADKMTRARLSGSAEPALGLLALDVAFSDVSLTTFTEGVKLPEAFSYLDVPLGLDISLDLSAAEGLTGADFEFTIGEGELYHPVAFPDHSPITYGIISGALNIPEERLTIERVELKLGETDVSGSGFIYWADEGVQPGVELKLTVDKVQVSEVKKYWPIRVHPDGRQRGARVWVDDNIVSGYAENVEFKVSINPDGSSPYLNGSVFELTFAVVDVDTSYIKTMEPLENLVGNAILTLTDFHIFVNSGTVAGMPIGGSVARMSRINERGKAYGVFEVALEGGVREVLELVNTKPVEINRRVKLDLDRLAGRAKIEAKISLPLVKRPPKDQILYEIKAFIKSGSLDGILGGEGLRAADVTVELDDKELIASGFGDVNGVPMELYWHENFLKSRQDAGADTSLLVMSGYVDENDILALGVDVRGYLEGKAHAEATFLGRALKFRVGYFSADVTDAKLMVSPIAWEKEVSSPATVTGTVHLLDKGARLAPLVVSGEGIDLRATFDFGVDGKGTYSGKVEASLLGKNIVTADIVRKVGSPITVNAVAEVFDLEKLLSRTTGKKTEVLQAGPVGENTAVDFDLKLQAETLLLMNGEKLSDVNLSLRFENDEPTALKVLSESEAGVINIEIGAEIGDMRSLTVSTPDAGKLLRGLGLFAHMQKGQLELEGETNGWGDDLHLSGTLKVRDTRLLAKKELSEHVSEGVISGLDEYLEDGSMPLSVIDLPFSYASGLLDINGLKANGPSLGMTMEGQIQTAENKVNVNGVVVPAYGLNSLLGKIPLLGNLFSGGAGKGLFGITYRVKGSISEPKVTFNPLSGLAPGFLRLLFEGRKGKVSDVEIPDEPVAVDSGVSEAMSKGEEEKDEADVDPPAAGVNSK